MLIKSVLAGLSRAASFGRGKPPLEAVTPKASADPPSSGITGATPATQLRDILANYDVTDISPQMFSDLLQRLHQSGLLPDSDLQELAMIRVDLDREGIRPNQRVNLVEMYARKLKAIEQDADELEKKLGTAGLRAMETAIRRRLDWLERLSTLHSSPDAARINAFA